MTGTSVMWFCYDQSLLCSCVQNASFGAECYVTVMNCSGFNILALSNHSFISFCRMLSQCGSVDWLHISSLSPAYNAL